MLYSTTVGQHLIRLGIALGLLTLTGCAQFQATASVGWSDHGVDTKSVVESNSKEEGVEA